MNKSEWKAMIEQYLDGELDEKREANLFSHLAQEEESREYFKKVSVIKMAVQESMETFPPSLDTRILQAVESSSQRSYQGFWGRNAFAMVSYSLLPVFLFLSIFFFLKLIHYREKLAMTIQQAQQQGETIHLLVNSELGAEVKSNFNNEIIITDKRGG